MLEDEAVGAHWVRERLLDPRYSVKNMLLRLQPALCTISSQVRCSASSRDMPSSLHRLRLVVLAHHTALQLHAQRPLFASISHSFFSSPVCARNSSKRTYSFRSSALLRLLRCRGWCYVGDRQPQHITHIATGRHRECVSIRFGGTNVLKTVVVDGFAGVL